MYREHAPPPDLAPLLACTWTSVARGGRILPDGCVDVVWDGADLVIAGPATIALDSPPLGTDVFGLRFRLGAAGAGLGLPAEELADARVPVTDVWPDGEAIREAAVLRGLPGLIDALRARLRAAETDPLTRAAALGLAIPGARVADLGAQLGISERQLRRRFADAVGYGPKTLARILRFQRFLAMAGDAAGGGVAAAGVRPGAAGAAGDGVAAAGVRAEAAGDGVAAAGVRAGAAGDGVAAPGVRAKAAGGGVAAAGVRAEAAGDGVAAPGDAAALPNHRWAPPPRDDLAGLAFAAGYADQAHLTRECRRLAGRTPAELVRLGVRPAGERRLWRA